MDTDDLKELEGFLALGRGPADEEDDDDDDDDNEDGEGDEDEGGSSAGGGKRKRGKNKATAKGKAKGAPPAAAPAKVPPKASFFAARVDGLTKGQPTLGEENEGEEEESLTTSLLDPSLHVVIATVDTVKNAGSFLEYQQPAYVVLYDADVAVVRMLEAYNAGRMSSRGGGAQAAPPSSSSSSSDQPAPMQQQQKEAVQVFFLQYESSLEENLYVMSLAREKRAFESLIQAKSKMAICLPDILVRGAGGGSDEGGADYFRISLDTRTVRHGAGPDRRESKQLKTLIVDIREFRSKLPSQLHAQGLAVLPRTLNVSDYVLAQEICVERKSVSDLFDSLKSGRLLAQAESMSRHYRRPCLLIEFTERGHFGLHAGELPAEVRDKDIISQMATLVLAFPQLRILWSRSIDVTPDIFCAIAAGHDPIDEKKAVEAGQAADSIDPRDRGEDTEAAEAEAAAKAILVSLPGVTTHNIHAVMDLAPTIAQLSRVGEDAMCMAIGAQSGKLLFEFFRSRKPLFLAMNQLR